MNIHSSALTFSGEGTAWQAQERGGIREEGEGLKGIRGLGKGHEEV